MNHATQKTMKELPSDTLASTGLLNHDWEALSPCQRECTSRTGMTLKLEQESYLSRHPEVTAMLQIFIGEMVKLGKRKDILQEAVKFFSRPVEDLDSKIRDKLGLPETGPYTKSDKPQFSYEEDTSLENDLKKIILKHNPPEPWKVPTPIIPTPDTVSSSFISIITSDTTLVTPEPIPTPEPTLSETFLGIVSNAVDKAIFSNVDDNALRYDTAYMELMKVVEVAMEIPVTEIKEDIAELFYNAYRMFELNIMEKERIAAEIAWERRMRKKLKRTLRRLDNFKGYVTPPTPKSQVSSHDSYKKPLPPPCVCQPHTTYNRYPKDRFGIYLPREEEYSDGNTTVTPAISLVNIEEDALGDKRSERDRGRGQRKRNQCGSNWRRELDQSSSGGKDRRKSLECREEKVRILINASVKCKQVNKKWQA